MLNVKDDWDKVKVGDRVRFYLLDGKTPRWEGEVERRGHRLATGSWDIAYFRACKTLNKDGSERKGGKTAREREFLGRATPFEIVKPIPDNAPNTFGELTDEHIGMRFEVDGTPEMVGTYEGRRDPADTKRAHFTEVMWRDTTYTEGREWMSRNSFTKAEGNQYIAQTRTPIRYVGGNPGNQPGEVDVDAKLAAYFNQELDKLRNNSEGVHANAKGPHGKTYGENIVAIMKKLTN